MIPASGSAIRVKRDNAGGAAFGVANNTRLTILQILTAKNARTADGNLYSGDQSLRNLAIIVYDGINRGGDIY
jgi:hypothetical protein